ncbi:MAG: porin [Steroidobacteraceae bacterium]
MHSGVRVPLLRLATFAALSALAGVRQAQGIGAMALAAAPGGSPPASSTTGASAAAGTATGGSTTSSRLHGKSAADQTTASLPALWYELAKQAEDLAELEKVIAAQEKEVQHPAQPASVGVVDANRFSIASPDGPNALRFGGLVQGDARYFTANYAPASDNTFLVRRARPIMEGTLYGMFDFRIMPDFGEGKTVLDDAYAAARFSQAAAITLGKFKVPVGLEMLQSPAELRFIERGLPSDLVPNRDVGAQLGGDVSGDAFGYAVGYFNGVTDGTSSDSDPTPDLSSVGRKDLAARIFV